MKTEEDKNNIPEPSIARLLKEDFEKRKRQLATFLSNQTQKLTPQNRKLLFLFTGIALGLAIIAMSYYAVRDANLFHFIKPEKVLPLQADPPVEEEIVTPEEYKVITSFRETLDSLQQHDPFSYEQLMQTHPGLLDSMNLIIHIYLSTH